MDSFQENLDSAEVEEASSKSSRRSISRIPRPPKLGAVALLRTYMVILFIIPAIEVFSPLGAAGGPQTIFSVILFLVYMWAWFDSSAKLDRRYQPIRWVSIILLLIMIASWVSANRHAMPVLERNSADRAIIFAFGWTGVMLIAADAINSLDELLALVRTLVNGVSLVAVVAVIQFFTAKNLADYIRIPGFKQLEPAVDVIRGSFVRPQATASHPIELGAVLVITLPLALHLAMCASPAKRRLRWLQVAFIGGTAPLTVSRSAILGLIVIGLVLLPVWHKQQRRIAYGIIVAFTLVTWVAVPGLVGTIRGLFQYVGNDSSTASRGNALAAAGTLIPQHPWLGRGPATLLPQVYFYVDDQYLSSLIETGILGTLALAAVFVAGWLASRNARRISADPEFRHLAQCFAACSAVPALSFATYDALSFPMATGLTFLIMGLVGALWRVARDGQSLDSSGPLETPLLERVAP